MDSTTDAQIPRVLPVVPGLVLAGQYALTEQEPRHRGDTLGACALPGDRVGLMVADMVGHGFGASLAAAELRALLWSFLHDGATLVEALEGLDRHAARHPEMAATAIGVAVLDLHEGWMEYAAGGLAPPLVLRPGGSPVQLEATGMRPLGTGGPMRAHSTRLGPDDMVVMSTNGFITTTQNDPGRDAVDLMVRAAQALDDSVVRGSPPCERADEVGRSILSRQFTGDMCDDVAVLVAQRMPTPEALSLRLDADTLDLGKLHRRIAAWLDDLGAGLADHIGLGHALMELATNVVNHAYQRSDLVGGWIAGHGDRPLRIDAALDETGAVVATVSDRGEWRAPGTGVGAGRGLTMAGGLVDSLRVDRSSEGTLVEIRSRLGRPVHLWQVEADPSTPAFDTFPDEMSTVISPGHLAASGPVDEASAELFHAALVEATHAGTVAATVDLTGVTLLASPGVQSLFDMSARSTRSGVRMDIVAPELSPARHILDLVGLAAGP